MTDDLFDLADTLGFQTPARRDPLKAPAMAFVAVEETGGPVNVPDVRARDEGRAGGAVGAATFTLPRTPPVPSFELLDATYTSACQALAGDVVYAMSFGEMDAWRESKVALACPCRMCDPNP